MKLEASLKHFSPQGMHISDDVKGTSPDRLTGTDVMAAIGTTSSRARFGLAAFSAISSATVHRAILKRLPDLHQSSWSRNWKPFYEMLVDTLRQGERHAAVEFEKATTY